MKPPAAPRVAVARLPALLVALVAGIIAGCASTPLPIASPPPATSQPPPPSASPTPTPTPTPSLTPTPTPTPSPSPSPTPTPDPPSGRIRLMAVGDVNLAWRVGERIASDGPAFVFERVAGFLQPADLVVANLECTLSDRGEPWPGKEEHFAAPAGAVDALRMTGVDVVTLANNHTLDFGREGLVDTLAILDGSGIASVGGGADRAAAHAPVVVELNGLRLALLSYVVPFSSKAGFNTRAWAATEGLPGVAIGLPDEVGADVAAARAVADVVVVFVHSGGEFRQRPKSNQVAMAQAAIAAGATLVIGHGPHNLQGYVREGRTLIAYSIGNFVFDDYVGRQNDSAILDVTLSADGVENVSWIPVEIEDGVPRPARADEVERILEQLALEPVQDD